MKGFYIVHDLDDLTIGIVPQDLSSKSKGEYGLQPELEKEPFIITTENETETPSEEQERTGPNLTPLWIGLGAGGAGLGVMSYFIVKKHKKDKEVMEANQITDWDWDTDEFKPVPVVIEKDEPGDKEDKGGLELVPDPQEPRQTEADNLDNAFEENVWDNVEHTDPFTFRQKYMTVKQASILVDRLPP